MAGREQWPAPANLSFVEALYERWREAPASVAPAWRRWFEDLARAGPEPRPEAADGSAERQRRVDCLVSAWRARGHITARLDPLGRRDPPPAELDPAFYGLGPEDLDRSFHVDGLAGADRLPLRTILERLRDIYGRSIGAQFSHIDDLEIRAWLQERFERPHDRPGPDRDEQLRIFTRLTDAVLFERFVRRKVPGAKTFSLEGAESLIPLLDLAIERAAEHGVRDVVIGMAHRGRLNVLTNIVGKSPSHIFHEFRDEDPERHLGGGDVKYHLGFSGDWSTAVGPSVHVTLAFNPSHLEFVDPVVLGRARARQDRAGRNRGGTLAILIHGDAAFVGEGVVQETLNLSQLDAYAVGGALHVVVNNQIGFTTPPEQGRSSRYPTDFCKALQIPIFHVNGEDPEAVATVVRLALDFRARFGRDAVIDTFCYRQHGHNEGDEPTFTQPLMYARIRERPDVRASYLEHLLGLGGVTREEADAIERRREAELHRAWERAIDEAYEPEAPPPSPTWRPYVGGPEAGAPEADTRYDRARLADLLRALTALPEGFRPHPKIVRFQQAWAEMAGGTRPVNWPAAEALAFATLAVEGHPVRLTGQDSERGTFGHRHAVLHDMRTDARHCPLRHLEPGQAPVEIHNSPLSEAGVLGFEYGYSLDRPEALVVWEAQFGDFANAAQVVIDQFIASAEDKWGRLSGLVLLLPHGFEGQGPEHSSARPERLLTLAAEDNFQLVQPTTPAQYFHVLRRQVRRPWRKPLFVLTPKSLLRHPRVTSSLDELAGGRFERVLTDDRPLDRARRVLLCSGKLYYELAAHRDEAGRDDVALVRLEQLYPFPDAALAEALAPVPDGTPVVWVQEDPENMGAWRFLRYLLGAELFGRLPFSGVHRPASASPATGSAASHRLEQARLIDRAFGSA